MKRRTAEQQILEAGLPNEVKLEVGLTQAATVLAMHTVMSGASMLKRLIRLIGADWKAIEEARKHGIDPEASQCADWWRKRPGPWGSPPIAGGFPIFYEHDGQVVLDVRNEQQLTVVRNILTVRERAHAILEGADDGND